jgi:hypothetical protein
MKHQRLVPTLLVLGCSLVMTAAIAYACSDKAKTTTAASAKSKVTAVTASNNGAACTAEQMAACASKGAKTSATTASMSGDACCMGKSKAKTSATTATIAPVGKVNAMAVGAGGSCGAKSSNTAMAAGSSCSAHGITGTAKAGHDCEACNDFAMCEGEVKANGANVQIVPLKNGVMYVYTANGAAKVQAVQSAMARRNQHMTAILASGDQATLCPECKSMRGAIASGKLNRENVNIEGGCMTLVTSSDPAMVSKIYALAGLKASGRNTKS